MATILPTLAKAFPPGDFIREELEERGWTQQQSLRSRIGRPLQTVNMIVNGHKAITAETAYKLQKVFGPSAIYWMNLESIWQLYKLNEKKKIAARREKRVERLASPESSSLPARTYQDRKSRDRSSGQESCCSATRSIRPSRDSQGARRTRGLNENASPGQSRTEASREAVLRDCGKDPEEGPQVFSEVTGLEVFPDPFLYAPDSRRNSPDGAHRSRVPHRVSGPESPQKSGRASGRPRRSFSSSRPRQLSALLPSRSRIPVSSAEITALPSRKSRPVKSTRSR